MRIVTCPKCSSTHCSEMATELVGEAVRMQCQGCGYYAERKEFKIEVDYDWLNDLCQEVRSTRPYFLR